MKCRDEWKKKKQEKLSWKNPFCWFRQCSETQMMTQETNSNKIQFGPDTDLIHKQSSVLNSGWWQLDKSNQIQFYWMYGAGLFL